MSHLNMFDYIILLYFDQNNQKDISNRMYMLRDWNMMDQRME